MELSAGTILGITGIFVGIVGFVFMTKRWNSRPTESFIHNWEIRHGTPSEDEKTEEIIMEFDTTSDWVRRRVTPEFITCWRIRTKSPFFMVIAGFILQIPQIIWG